MKFNELIKLAQDNNLIKNVRFMDASDISDEDYIFIDRLQDRLILADGKKKMVISGALISVYAKQYERLENTINYFTGIFNCSPVYARELDYYKCSFECEVFVDEWQGN